LFKEAACDLICSFDDDSWPLDRDYFAQVKAIMDVFPKAAILSPAVFLKEKPVQPRLPEVSESVSFEGSASVTRQSLYLQLPGYVPVAHAYGVEEADLSLQVHAAGYQVLNSPWLRAWHDRPYSDYQHGIVPWVRNEVLLSYLRYPRWLQPWGWLRALRHVVRHRKTGWSLIQALGGSAAHCFDFRKYRKRYSTGQIWDHHFANRQRWQIRTRPECNVPLSIEIEPAPSRGKVLYLQYTNPAAYPPLQHGSQVLARKGWDIHFMGLQGRSGSHLEFPPFPRIQVFRMPPCAPGLRQKMHYLRYVAWTAWHAWRTRPDWIYCSESLSSLPGLGARALSGARVVFHEHDSPTQPKADESWFSHFCHRRRHSIAMKADAVVLPNQKRLEAFLAEHNTPARSFCIWNCPSLSDIPETSGEKPEGGTLRILYHGTIVPERFPLTTLKALADCGRDVTIRLIGYEVPGMMGYTESLKAEAARLGVAERFECLGTLPQRSDLMARAAECQVGLSLLQYRSTDINMRHMVGASNKPFDYLSQGLALIVPREPEWEAMYVQEGCALACEPENVEELTQVFQWLADHRTEVTAMGERGRQLIATQWNYECQFQPLVEMMEKLQEHQN
jgi:glycosyltransferase involved in cell wall biosynthesis